MANTTRPNTVHVSPAVHAFMVAQLRDAPEVWGDREHVLVALCGALTLAMRTAREMVAEDAGDGVHVRVPGENDLGAAATRRLVLALVRPVKDAMHVAAMLPPELPREERGQRLNRATADVVQACLLWAEREGYATDGATVAGTVRGVHYAALDQLRRGDGPLPPDAGNMTAAAGIAGIERLIRHLDHAGDEPPPQGYLPLTDALRKLGITSAKKLESTRKAIDRKRGKGELTAGTFIINSLGGGSAAEHLYHPDKLRPHVRR